MLDKILQKAAKLTAWQFLLLFIVLSEIITASMTILLSLTLWGRIFNSVLIISAVDAFVASSIVASIGIYLIRETTTLTVTNEQLRTEIRNRESTEEKLRRSESFLQTVIETEPECIKLLLSDGTLQMMNRAGLTMIEADSFAQVKGRCVYPLVASEYREAFKTLTEQVFKGQSGTLEFEMIGLKGSHLWLETQEVPLRDEHNEILASLGVTRNITEKKMLETEKDKLISDLKKALTEVKTLRGMLPICASCKKIRDDKGYWNQIESYIRDHSEAEFTHSLCPDCVQKLYPQLHKKDNK